MIITELFIPGRPVTKGSLTRVGDRLTDTPQSKAWRRVMAGAIRDDLRRRWALDSTGRPPLSLHQGPVDVYAAWFLPGDPMAVRAGDIDKLVRNLLDALSAPTERTTDRSLCAGAIVDDNQVQTLTSHKLQDATAPGVVVGVAAALPSSSEHYAYAQARLLKARLTA